MKNTKNQVRCDMEEKGTCEWTLIDEEMNVMVVH